MQRVNNDMHALHGTVEVLCCIADSTTTTADSSLEQAGHTQEILKLLSHSLIAKASGGFFYIVVYR